MTLPKRHLDTGQMDWQFLDVLWVHCPRCHQKTEYKRTRCQKCHHITCIVHCPCGFVFDTHTNPTYVGDIQKQEVRHRERCHYCGNQLLLKKTLPKNQITVPKTLPITCPICQKTSHFTIHRCDVVQYYPDDITLTVYGFSLYLQTLTRRGVICVYNPAHLKEFKKYITADLRERLTQTSNSSYFSRLPAWIKSAQYKQDVIKALERLEKLVIAEQN